MEWCVPVNEMLRNDITKITHTLLPPGIHGDISSIRLMQNSLAQVIDALGEQSTAAQGVNKVITTAEKLRNSPSHNLYLLKDSGAKGGKGEVVALLKVGRKHLFLYDERDVVREVEPLCVLDFYVRADRQRQGLGRLLFDHMLKEEGVSAEQLAIDGPSPKMEQFLRKNYGVDRLVRQSNNFAVSPRFFASGDHSVSGRTTPVASAAVGRFAAHKPPSAIANVIHGGGSGNFNQVNSRASSRGVTPEFDREPDYAPERPPSTVPQRPPSTASEPAPEPQAPSPERPTTLQVEAIQTALLSVGKEDSAAASPAGSAPSRRDSQLTERGYFDVKFYHNKLW